MCSGYCCSSLSFFGHFCLGAVFCPWWRLLVTCFSDLFSSSNRRTRGDPGPCEADRQSGENRRHQCWDLGVHPPPPGCHSNCEKEVRSNSVLYHTLMCLPLIFTFFPSSSLTISNEIACTSVPSYLGFLSEILFSYLQFVLG